MTTPTLLALTRRIIAKADDSRIYVIPVTGRKDNPNLRPEKRTIVRDGVAFPMTFYVKRESEQPGLFDAPTPAPAPTAPPRMRPLIPPPPPKAPPVTMRPDNPSSNPDAQLYIGPGDILRSDSGRELTPAPKFTIANAAQHAKANRAMDAWLLENARAEVANDDYRSTLLAGMNPKRLTPSDRDTVNAFLFGDDGDLSAKERHLVRRGPPPKTKRPTPSAEPDADLLRQARALGKAAYERGAPRAPALDPDFMALTPTHEPVGGPFAALARAFLHGYTAANLAAPLPSDEPTPEPATLGDIIVPDDEPAPLTSNHRDDSIAVEVDAMPEPTNSPASAPIEVHHVIISNRATGGVTKSGPYFSLDLAQRHLEGLTKYTDANDTLTIESDTVYILPKQRVRLTGRTAGYTFSVHDDDGGHRTIKTTIDNLRREPDGYVYGTLRWKRRVVHVRFDPVIDRWDSLRNESPHRQQKMADGWAR